jgi:membrane-associated protease RseP (regulator of RpoE activity)
MSVLFGSSLGNLLDIVIWVFAIFTAILIHEMGHAIAMQIFKQPSQVVLHFAGGLTVPEQPAWGSSGYSRLSPNQEIVVYLAGPGAGFLLAAILLNFVFMLGGSISVFYVLGFIPIPIGSLPSSGILNTLIHHLLWISIFWGGINLMPVYPLDGGNVARRLFMKFDPWGGLQKSLWLSIITGGLLALLGFLVWGSIYMGLMFGIFAYESYQNLQNSKGY